MDTTDLKENRPKPEGGQKMKEHDLKENKPQTEGGKEMKGHDSKGGMGNGSMPAAPKTPYSEASLKELMAKPDVQDAIRSHVHVPDSVIIKAARKPFKDEGTGTTTQKVEGVSGTSLFDVVTHHFTLVNTEIDPIASINKTFRLSGCSFALDANMAGGKFNGYAAKGLKLLVTRIEEVEGGAE